MGADLTEEWKAENLTLQALLALCDIPEQRRDDLAWLSRNLLIRNQSPEAFHAMAIIKKRLRWERIRWNGSQTTDG